MIVVMHDDRHGPSMMEPRELDNLGPPDGVGGHLAGFVLCEGRGLLDQFRGDFNFADVVEQRATRTSSITGKEASSERRSPRTVRRRGWSGLSCTGPQPAGISEYFDHADVGIVQLADVLGPLIA